MATRKINLALGLPLLVLSLASCQGTVSSSDISSSEESPSSSEETPDPTDKYGLSLPYKEGFRILWLTDLHFGNPTNTSNYDEEKEYAHLRSMIEKANNPDLIVITGDAFERETAEQVDTFVSFIDSFNLKWAFTYGNHDPSTLIEDPYYINRQIMAAKNSVFVDYENDEIDGLTNYFINLESAGKTVYRLYLIDSHSSKPSGAGGDSVYDVIHLNQLQHLKAIYDEQGDQAPGLAFYHIPLREYVDAYQGYSDGLYQGRGVKRDPFGYGYKNNGAYEAFKEAGIIGSFCGHDHRNDFDIDYFDNDNHMVLSYGLKGSDLNYCDADLIGYKIMVLPSNPATFSHSSIAETLVGY